MLLASNFLVRALCIKQLITQLVGSATIFSLNDKSNPRYRREQNKNICLQKRTKRVQLTKLNLFICFLNESRRQSY